jgi:drug/metabolite transporter (DMT)-like permease
VLVVALALSLLAAVMHAAWNVAVKPSGDPLRLMTTGNVWATALLTPPAGVGWWLEGRPALPPAAWLILVVSGLVELVYFLFLSRAYRRGELSAVYPIARGTAPVVAILVGLLLLGERLSPLQLLGVGAVLVGILAVLRPSGSGRAVVPALLTGVSIAVYVSLDRVGVRMGSVWLYAWAIFALTTIFLLAWVVTHPSREAAERIPLRQGALIGALMAAAYTAVLFALSFAPLSVVAAVREVSIVMVAIWGVWKLGERGAMGWRLGGATLTLAGSVVLAAS